MPIIEVRRSWVRRELPSQSSEASLDWGPHDFIGMVQKSRSTCRCLAKAE